jgi:uncharacterized protein (TIRG00374 family)
MKFRGLLQFFFIGLIVIWIFFRLEIKDVTLALKEASYPHLGLGFLVSLSSLLLASVRWVALLSAMQIAYTKTDAFRAYLQGNFYALLLPGMIGSDLIRLGKCRNASKGAIASISVSILFERLIGVGAVIWLLSVGILLQDDNSLLISWFVKAISVFSLVSVILLCMAPKYVARLLHHINSCGLFRKFDKDRCSKAITVLEKMSPRLLLKTFMISIAFQSADFIAVLSLSRGIDIYLPLNVIYLALPVSYLATVLPLSPSGLGIREFSFAAVAMGFGYSEQEATLLAVFIFFNRVAIGLVGGLDSLIQLVFKKEKLSPITLDS